MTISSSLNAGVAGLTANATRLATISDNIANSATYGYKRADSEFSPMVLDSGAGTIQPVCVSPPSARSINRARFVDIECHRPLQCGGAASFQLQMQARWSQKQRQQYCPLPRRAPSKPTQRGASFRTQA